MSRGDFQLTKGLTPYRQRWPVYFGATVTVLLGCSDPATPQLQWRWEPIALDAAVGTLAIAADGTLYAGAGDGVYTSDPDGAQWRYLSESWIPRTRRSIDDLACGPERRVACATRAGLYVSDDAGQTWYLAEFFTSQGDTIGPTEVDITPEGTIFIGLHYRVLRSQDGRSWTQVYASPSTRDFSITYISAAGNSGIFFGTRFDWDFRSFDGGDKWQRFSILESSPEYRPYTQDLISFGNILLASSYSGLFESHDNGDTWKVVATGPLFTDLAVGRSGVFAGSYEGEVHQRSEGESDWVQIGESLGMQISSIAVSGSGTVFVAATMHDRTASRLFRGR